jgi:hypothetical protein
LWAGVSRDKNSYASIQPEFAADSEVYSFVPLMKDDQILEARPVPTTRYKSLLRYFAVRFCVAVTLGVMVLAVVELYAYKRYLPAERDALEPAVKLDLDEGGTPAEREYWKEFDASNKVTYHQYVLWRRSPYQGELIAIDQDGVRRTLHTQCDNKTFAIWMFGDSVMWGSGTPDSDTIPSLIAQDYEKSGKPVCIVNYAEKGWSNTQEMLELIEQLKHTLKRPDVVLFYDGGTEAFAAYQSGRADVHSNYNSFRKFLDGWATTQKAGFAYFRQTNTYRLLERIAIKMPFHRKPDTTPDTTKEKLDTETLSAQVIENYVQNMDVVNLLGKQYGFRAVFAWYPNLAVGHKEQTPYEQQVMRLEYQKFPDLGAMYKAVYDRGHEIDRSNFYNLSDAVDDQKSTLYRGISHMRPEGDRIVADHLFDILEGKGLVPPSARRATSIGPGK